MNPKVSIIISTYDRAERLKNAIKSVVTQTYKDWELIVVHDGAWIEYPMSHPNIQDDRITYGAIAHFGNDTRPKNHGIKHAFGEYVTFLDDDNTWRPDHLQALVGAMEKDPTLDVVYGDRWVVNEIDPKFSGPGITLDKYSSMALMERNFIDTSDVLIRKEALQYVGGFDERYKKFVDWNLWVRLDKAGFRFQRVPLILTDYHLHESSKSLRPEDSKGDLIPAWNPVDLEIRLPFLGPVKPPRVAIFSLTYNRLEYTKKCFESLHKTAGYEFDHYVVDNGSTDGTPTYLRARVPGKIIILNKENVGISKASNQALDRIDKAAPYDIIGKVDNDAFFLTDGWLAKMVKLWETNHRLAMSPYVQGLVHNPGGAPREGQGFISGEFLGMARHIGGICVFADRKAWEGFRHDESDFLHGTQDLEFSQHIRQKGFQCAYLENFFVEHYEGTDGQEKRYPDYFKRRREVEKRTRYEESK